MFALRMVADYSAGSVARYAGALGVWPFGGATPGDQLAIL